MLYNSISWPWIICSLIYLLVYRNRCFFVCFMFIRGVVRHESEPEFYILPLPDGVYSILVLVSRIFIITAIIFSNKNEVIIYSSCEFAINIKCDIFGNAFPFCSICQYTSHTVCFWAPIQMAEYKNEFFMSWDNFFRTNFVVIL